MKSRPSIKPIAMKGTAAPIMTSVIIAALLSASGAFVSVKVMSSDLERAKIDLSETSTTVIRLDREMVGFRAAKNVADERDANRWTRIEAELAGIHATQSKILRALPSRWRDEQQHR